MRTNNRPNREAFYHHSFLQWATLGTQLAVNAALSFAGIYYLANNTENENRMPPVIALVLGPVPHMLFGCYNMQLACRNIRPVEDMKRVALSSGIAVFLGLALMIAATPLKQDDAVKMALPFFSLLGVTLFNAILSGITYALALDSDIDRTPASLQ